jgi:hypothetical protein
MTELTGELEAMTRNDQNRFERIIGLVQTL